MPELSEIFYMLAQWVLFDIMPLPEKIKKSGKESIVSSFKEKGKKINELKSVD